MDLTLALGSGWEFTGEEDEKTPREFWRRKVEREIEEKEWILHLGRGERFAT